MKGTGRLLIKQIGMGASADEPHESVWILPLKPIDQKEIAPDMTFPMVRPLPAESMIQPLRPQRPVVGDQKQDHFLQLPHIIAA